MRVVYNSFHGRYSDSPRAVYERLDGARGVEHVWLADPDHAAGFRSDARLVDITSPEAGSALDSSDVVIANTHTEVEWGKSGGTTYVQTWHGTPLKRVHHDVLWAPEGRLARLDRDIATWDLLLSPNAESTPRLCRAFRYGGKVLENGYPRNDALLSKDSSAVRDRTRAGLGLAEGVTVVLYAPTWRDDEKFVPGEPRVPLALDLRSLSELLGPDYVVLVRLHPLMTGRSAPEQVPGVVDVSYHPDLSDLYLAADVLVTDYSSAMFDFAITGRPIVYFAYDLDRFRDEVRGFYFDLVDVAPGPLTDTTAGLAAALAELTTIEHRYADRYAAFRRRFCHLEDGQATDRLLRHLGLAGTS